MGRAELCRSCGRGATWRAPRGIRRRPPSPWPRALLFAALLSLSGCSWGAGGTALTVINSTEKAVTVEGLPGGPVPLLAGSRHRVEGIGEALRLRARAAGSQTLSLDLPLAPPGGESIWDLGGGTCFVEGDYSSWYAGPGAPSAAQVLGIKQDGQLFYQSSGAIHAPPGERLPKKRRGDAVRALVEIPCAGAVNEPIARGWLEMKLLSIEPPP